MKWTWKHISAILFAVMVSSSAYIVKASGDESSFVPQISYYGSCENAIVEILATNNFNHFQNTINSYNLFENDILLIWNKIKICFYWDMLFYSLRYNRLMWNMRK